MGLGLEDIVPNYPRISVKFSYFQIFAFLWKVQGSSITVYEIKGCNVGIYWRWGQYNWVIGLVFVEMGFLKTFSFMTPKHLFMSEVLHFHMKCITLKVCIKWSFSPGLEIFHAYHCNASRLDDKCLFQTANTQIARSFFSKEIVDRNELHDPTFFDLLLEVIIYSLTNYVQPTCVKFMQI